MIANRLNYGDTIGIVAPSNYLDEYRIETLYKAEEFFKLKGFKIKRGEHIFDNWYGSAGTPENRAKDINRMFLDQDVTMIICIEGGSTCNSILPYLDFDIIKNNPKIFMGYSDVTVLLNAIYEKTGLVTFHGAEFYQYGISELQSKLWDNIKKTLIENNNYLDYCFDMKIMKSGRAKGLTVGTNLGCLMNLLGTPYFPSVENKILLMESYQIKETECVRRFYQLLEAGVFNKINGIVIGYIDAFQKDNINDSRFEDILMEVINYIDIPIIKCNFFGHEIANEIIPIGVNMDIDTFNNKILIEENYLK